MSTPNMNLPVPSVGTTSGPAYASDINQCLNLIDQHTHAAGSGVQLTPDALNINSDLPMNGHNLTLTQSIQFQAVASLSTSSSIYVVGGNLYYNYGATPVQITSGTSVAGAAGNLSPPPSGTASLGWIGGGTFAAYASTSVPASMSIASVLLGLATTSPNRLTLSPPSGLSGGSYSLYLPTIPAQTNVMTLDSSGNMGSVTFDAVGQTMTSVGAQAIATTMGWTGADTIGTSMTASGANAVALARTRATNASTITTSYGGVVISSSCGSAALSTGAPAAVTNLSVTLRTIGRPIVVQLQSDGSAFNSCNIAVPGNATLYIYRNGVQAARFAFSNSYPNGGLNSIYFPVSIQWVDTNSGWTPLAQSTTYQIYGSCSYPAYLQFAKLVAYEL